MLRRFEAEVINWKHMMKHRAEGKVSLKETASFKESKWINKHIPISCTSVICDPVIILQQLFQVLLSLTYLCVHVVGTVCINLIGGIEILSCQSCNSSQPNMMNLAKTTAKEVNIEEMITSSIDILMFFIIPSSSFIFLVPEKL